MVLVPATPFEHPCLLLTLRNPPSTWSFACVVVIARHSVLLGSRIVKARDPPDLENVQKAFDRCF